MCVSLFARAVCASLVPRAGFARNIKNIRRGVAIDAVRLKGLAARANSTTPTCASSRSTTGTTTTTTTRRTAATGELLCIYCHDNEHQRYLDQPGMTAGDTERSPQATTDRSNRRARLVIFDDAENPSLPSGRRPCGWISSGGRAPSLTISPPYRKMTLCDGLSSSAHQGRPNHRVNRRQPLLSPAGYSCCCGTRCRGRTSP